LPEKYFPEFGGVSRQCDIVTSLVHGTGQFNVRQSKIGIPSWQIFNVSARN